MSSNTLAMAWTSRGFRIRARYMRSTQVDHSSSGAERTSSTHRVVSRRLNSHGAPSRPNERATETPCVAAAFTSTMAARTAGSISVYLEPRINSRSSRVSSER